MGTAYGTTIGNTTSYSESSDWALQVTAWTWNDQTYSPSEEDVSGAALLQSSTSYIAVPESLYIDISFQMEYAGWSCITSQTPEENYCYIRQNCTDSVKNFPEFSMEFNNSASSDDFQVFSVQIFPEVYLQQSEDGSMCTSLFREIDSTRDAGFILGTPFFRNVSVVLNYAEQTIAVQLKEVHSPIAKGIDLPYMDESKQSVHK